MSEEAYLDISIIRCPNCRKLYVDSSWYVIDMESDIQCGECGEIFNTRKNLLKRILLKFTFIKNGVNVEIVREITD